MGSRPSREDSECQGDVGLDVTPGTWPGSALHPAGFGKLQEPRRGQRWVRGHSLFSGQAGTQGS